MGSPNNWPGILTFFGRRLCLNLAGNYGPVGRFRWQSAEAIRKSFTESYGAYGYRRIHLSITAEGKVLSEKVVRRLMKEENLVVLRVRKKRFNSHMGEITPAVENLIDRDFHADAPNKKWLTEITEFHIPAGKVVPFPYHRLL